MKLKCSMTSSSIGNVYASSYELGVAMQQAFTEDTSNQFIHDVKCLREHAVVVATARQLNDIMRFCAPPSNFSIMTVDPTFSLDDFNVTVITKLPISR